MTGELYIRALAVLKRSTLIWSGLLALFALSVIALWPSMSGSGSLDSMMDGLSPELASAFGVEDYGSAVGFVNGNLYAIVLPALLAVMAITQTASLTAGDEDAGRLELLMALPVSRTRIYVARFAAVATNLGVASVAVGAIVGVGGLVVDMGLSLDGIVTITLNLYLFSLFHAGIVFALAGAGWRSTAASGTAYGILGLGYVLHALVPLAGWDGVARISPWHWALGNTPLTSGFDLAVTGQFIGWYGICVVGGIAALNRRSIRTA